MDSPVCVGFAVALSAPMAARPASSNSFFRLASSAAEAYCQLLVSPALLLPPDNVEVIGLGLRPDVVACARIFRQNCPLPAARRCFQVLENVDPAVHSRSLSWFSKEASTTGDSLVNS